MAEEQSVQRWTSNRKSTLVIELIKGKRTMAEVCREYDLKQSDVEEWTEQFIQGGKNRLRSRPREEKALFEAREKELKAKIGDLVMEVEVLKKASAPYESDEETS